MSTSTIAKPAALETRVGALLQRFIYAVYDDVEDIATRDTTLQNYTNFNRDKKDAFGLFARFAVGTDVKQFLSILFTALADESVAVGLTDKDATSELIREKITSRDAPHIWAMWNFLDTKSDDFGPTLMDACDEGNWFISQLSGRLTKSIKSLVVVSILGGVFINFVKSMSWYMVKSLQWCKSPINGKLFLSIAAMMGFEDEVLTGLNAGLRPKTAKARAPKGGAKTTTRKTKDAVSDEEGDEEEEEEEKALATSAKTTTTNAAAIADILGKI